MMVSSVVALLSTPSESSTRSTMDDIIVTILSRSASAAAVAPSSSVVPSSPPLLPPPPEPPPSSVTESNTEFRRLAAEPSVLVTSTTELASTALRSIFATAALTTLAACERGGAFTQIVSWSDAKAPTISMQRTSTTSAYESEGSPSGTEVVEVFMTLFAPRRTARFPVVADAYPKDHFRGSESGSSTQSFVSMRNLVDMVVPFFGETLKLPPQGCRPALMVNCPQSYRPYRFVAVNLKVSTQSIFHLIFVLFYVR